MRRLPARLEGVPARPGPDLQAVPHAAGSLRLALPRLCYHHHTTGRQKQVMWSYILNSQAHWVAIDYTAKCRQFTRPVLALHCSALLEVAVAALATLLLSPPVGSLHLTSCGVVRQLSLTYRARGFSNLKKFKDIEWNLVALHVTGCHQACGLGHPPVQPSP